MIERTLLHLSVMLLAIYSYSIHANQSGALFNIGKSGLSTSNTVAFTLCLSGKGPASCQNYQTNKDTLSITTTIPSTHIYPAAGIKMNTSGYSAYYLGTACTMNQDNYCLFSVSNMNPALITLFTPGWSNAIDIDGTHSLSAVSCVSSSFCMAVDTVGNAIRYNGSDVNTTNIDGSFHLTSVSCPSSSFCMAVDSRANVLAFNGITWSGATSLGGGGTFSANSVSCPSSSFCMAVDSQGHAYKYTNGTWGTLTSVAPFTEALYSVSCANSSFCVAVSAQGNAYLYP